MAKRLLFFAVLVAFGLATFAGAVRAGQEGDGSIYGNYPPEFTKENPYADQLSAARKALDESIRRFWEVYSRDPWNYWVIVEAYWAYANAYQHYTLILWKYWDWERNNQAFSGRILTRTDGPVVIPMSQTEQTAQMMPIRPVDQPVAGATIRLVSGPIIYYGTKPGDPQPLATTQQPVTADQSIAPGGCIPPQRTFSATSDGQGKFNLRNLPKGQYNYTVTKEGFSAAHGAVEIGNVKQERDIYITRYRVFEGAVYTVPQPIWTIIKPMLVRAGPTQVAAGTASATGAPEAIACSAEDVEKILGTDARIQPHLRKLIPVDGARVALRSLRRMPMPLAGTTQPSEPTTATATVAAEPSTAGVSADLVRCPPFPIDPSTSTDGNGKFRFENLPYTSYQVVVEKQNYIPFRAMITLDGNRTFKRIVIFPPVPGEPIPMPVPLPAQQTDPQGGSLNDPFTR